MNLKKLNRQRPLHYILWGVGGLILAAAAAFFFGFILMLLWNWLMPVIFGLPAITFWQGWGLVLLCHILFKSGGHDHGHPNHHHGDFKKKFNERLKTHLPHNADENPETAC